jgi:hypothetical protein
MTLPEPRELSLSAAIAMIRRVSPELSRWNEALRWLFGMLCDGVLQATADFRDRNGRLLEQSFPLREDEWRTIDENEFVSLIGGTKLNLREGATPDNQVFGVNVRIKIDDLRKALAPEPEYVPEPSIATLKEIGASDAKGEQQSVQANSSTSVEIRPQLPEHAEGVAGAVGLKSRGRKKGTTQYPDDLALLEKAAGLMQSREANSRYHAVQLVAEEFCEGGAKSPSYAKTVERLRKKWPQTDARGRLGKNWPLFDRQ